MIIAPTVPSTLSIFRYHSIDGCRSDIKSIENSILSCGKPDKSFGNTSVSFGITSNSPLVSLQAPIIHNMPQHMLDNPSLIIFML